MTYDIPTVMKAVKITEPGGPEVLEIKEFNVPSPNEDEVLVKVASAGVNRPDCLQRLGKYPPPPGITEIPGLEIAGEVVSVGENVDPSLLGKRVMALIAGGGYAEYATAAAESLLPIPDGMNFTQAAAFPETYFTVWHNLFERGGLNADDTLLIHGGTSGIGTTAIQLAKAFGATVIATAGSAEKCEACLKLGADHAINYRDTDFVEEVKNLTDGVGASVILDMVGGSYIGRNFDAAAVDGRIVQIAFLQGAVVEADFRKLMIKRLHHTGSTLRARPQEVKSSIAKDIIDNVLPLVQEGKVGPVMDSTFPITEVQAAHARMEGGDHIGKIVLTFD